MLSLCRSDKKRTQKNISEQSRAKGRHTQHIAFNAIYSNFIIYRRSLFIDMSSCVETNWTRIVLFYRRRVYLSVEKSSWALVFAVFQGNVTNMRLHTFRCGGRWSQFIVWTERLSLKARVSKLKAGRKQMLDNHNRQIFSFPFGATSHFKGLITLSKRASERAKPKIASSNIMPVDNVDLSRCLYKQANVRLPQNECNCNVKVFA